MAETLQHLQGAVAVMDQGQVPDDEDDNSDDDEDDEVDDNNDENDEDAYDNDEVMDRA